MIFGKLFFCFDISIATPLSVDLRMKKEKKVIKSKRYSLAFQTNFYKTWMFTSFSLKKIICIMGY